MSHIFINHLSSNLDLFHDKTEVNLRFNVSFINGQLMTAFNCFCIPLDRMLKVYPQATMYLSLQEPSDLVDSLKMYEQLSDLLVNHTNHLYLCSNHFFVLQQLKKELPNIKIGVPIDKKTNFRFLGEVDFFSFEMNEWPTRAFAYLQPLQQLLSAQAAGKEVFLDHCNSPKDFIKYLEIQSALYRSKVLVMSDCAKNIAPCFELYRLCEYRMQAYKILTGEPKKEPFKKKALVNFQN